MVARRYFLSLQLVLQTTLSHCFPDWFIRINLVPLIFLVSLLRLSEIGLSRLDKHVMPSTNYFRRYEPPFRTGFFRSWTMRKWCFPPCETTSCERSMWTAPISFAECTPSIILSSLAPRRPFSVVRPMLIIDSGKTLLLILSIKFSAL